MSELDVKLMSREAKDCLHDWKSSGYVVATSPETYHRRCVLCRRVEAQSGSGGWHECFESPTYEQNREVANA